MSEDESKIPDRDTCQKLTEDFAAITETNEALAQTFLQDHEWDLDKSVNAFYDALSKEAEAGQSLNSFSPPGSSKRYYDPETVEKLFGEGKKITTEPPPHLKFLSWNLDGLEDKNLKRRTKAVIKTILSLEPDVVFFQEVVPITADYIETKLPEYKCIKGGSHHYFTMTMLRVFTIFYDNHEVVDFPETSMARNLLITEAHMGKLKLKLINTHLESTSEHSRIRTQQLKMGFEMCSKFGDEYTVIYGGDLNLRDSEAHIPIGFFDLWEYCGSSKEFRFTWDMTRNTNHSVNGKFKPKCRFDRIYFRYGKPQRARPKHFALTGFEKVPNTQSFPSDHWGVVAIFDLNHSI